MAAPVKGLRYGVDEWCSARRREVVGSRPRSHFLLFSALCRIDHIRLDGPDLEWGMAIRPQEPPPPPPPPSTFQPPGDPASTVEVRPPVALAREKLILA